jgi:hypothetical protein
MDCTTSDEGVLVCGHSSKHNIVAVLQNCARKEVCPLAIIKLNFQHEFILKLLAGTFVIKNWSRSMDFLYMTIVQRSWWERSKPTLFGKKELISTRKLMQ